MSEKIRLGGVEAVAWDLDGTLIDSFDLYLEIITKMAEQCGQQLPSRSELLDHYHGSLYETLSWVFKTDDADEINNIITEFNNIQHKHYDSDVDHHFYKDAVSLAHNADKQRMKQIVVTNRNHKRQRNASPRSIIERSAIAEFINEIRCGDEVIARKPNPEAVDDWLEAHNVMHEKLLVIGDQAVDAKLAINLGSRAVLVARHGPIRHLDEIPKEKRNSIIEVNTLDEIEISR